MRVPGVGPQYSDLLEAAGVDSPAELAQRNPTNLAITVQEVVAERPGIVRRIPTEAEIAAWVAGGQHDREGRRALTSGSPECRPDVGSVDVPEHDNGSDCWDEPAQDGREDAAGDRVAKE